MAKQRAGLEDVGDLGRAIGERVLQILGGIALIGLDLLAALLPAIGIACTDRLVAGHLLDDPRHIIIAPGNLHHAVGETAVVHLDGIEIIGRRLHLRDDVTHFLVESFEQILESDGRRGLQDRLQLLDQIVGVEKRHAP